MGKLTAEIISFIVLYRKHNEFVHKSMNYMSMQSEFDNASSK